MNILIYFGNQLHPQNGGTERVACLLSDYLTKQGHCITYLCCYDAQNKGAIASHFLPDGNESTSQNNIQFVKELLENEKIDVIINEGGNGDAIYLFTHKVLGYNVKIITHLHFDVLGEQRCFYKALSLPLTCVTFKSKFINVLKWIKAPINKYNAIKNKKYRFKYMLQESDAVVVLTDQYKEDYKTLIKRGDFTKLRSFKNPISFASIDISHLKKENKILFVGRLDYSTKRVDRVLKVWNQVHGEYLDWSLSIVGDGADRGRLEEMSRRMKLLNVRFEGRADSSAFYAKSKILVMTSNFEGTPMVIPEAMAFGVVPVVMNTFAGADDFIIDGSNGCLTKPFDIQDMSITLKRLMRNEDELSLMSKKAFETIKGLNNEEILSQWDDLLLTINDEKYGR